VAHSYTNLLYHLVFSTKERQPWLNNAIRPAVFGCLGGILAKLRPDRSVSHTLSDLKSRSSGWMHRTHPDLAAFAWRTGYGAFTVSQSQVEVVRTYIQNQEKHHQRMPFQDELRELLRRHGHEVDESLLWQ
jgi:REP element-mobilizing transposase RayT